MVAVSAETTATKSILNQIERRMKNSEEGSRILIEKPRISSTTLDLNKLAQLPKNTLGRQYTDMLDKYVSYNFSTCFFCAFF